MKLLIDSSLPILLMQGREQRIKKKKKKKKKKNCVDVKQHVYLLTYLL